MAKHYRGSHDASGLRFGIVVARFNHDVTDRLLDGACKALRQHGCAEDDIEIVSVPGAFEIPFFAGQLAERGGVDAIITLGAIVRGETQHHDYLGHCVFGELQRVASETGVPVTLGVLTTENLEQALQRAADDPGNKGFEAAETAIEIATLRAGIG